MKKTLKFLFLIICCLLSTSLFFACGKEKPKTEEKDASLYDLVLGQESVTIYLYEEGFQLDCVTKKDKVSVGGAVVWKSSNESVVTVNGGYLKPVGVGTATVTATWQEITKTCSVTISDLFAPYIKTNYETIGFTLGVSPAIQVTSKVVYIDENFDTSKAIISYSINQQDKNIATVSSDGLVTPKGVGTTTLKIVAQFNGANIQKFIPINVSYDIETHAHLKAGESTSIYLQNFEYDGVEYKNTTAFGYTVAYSDESGKVIIKDESAVVEWSSSDDSVATVDKDGNVRAISEGTAKISCSFEKDGEVAVSELIEISVLPYLMVDKTEEIRVGFNKGKINSISSDDIFEDDVDIVALYQKGSKTNLYNDNQIDVSSLELGNYEFVVVGNKGYAYSINSVVYSLNKDTNLSLYNKNGMYFWSPSGDCGGEVKYQEVIDGKTTLISSHIDIGNLPTGDAISFYWILNLSKDDIWCLIQDGVLFVEIEYYADWNGDGETRPLFYAMNLDELKINLNKATWSTFKLNLQYLYDYYDAISNATASEYLFRLATISGVNQYSFAISKIELCEALDSYSIMSAEELNLVSSAMAKKYYLENDIVVNLVAKELGADVFGISRLDTVFDLKGHKITVNVDVDNEWAYANVKFIKEITRKGVITNGIIEFNYNGHDKNMHPDYKKGLLVDIMKGSFKDIEIIGSITPVLLDDGLFGEESTGTFENICLRLTINSIDKTRFGIFEKGFANAKIYNCIFITNIFPVAGDSTITSFDGFNAHNVFYGPSYVSYEESNYDISSFNLDVWTINADINLPLIRDEKIDTKRYVNNQSELSNISGEVGLTYYLSQDLTIDLAGYIITTLSSVLNLNGHTITLNAVNSDMWDTRCFINEITETGAVINGRIVCNYTASNMAIFPKAMVIDVNDGLVKDVQFDGNFFGSTNFAMGFLGVVGCDGIYENVVFRASSPVSCYFGIFNHYDDYGAMGNITLKNCIFIAENTQFSAYYPGNIVATIDAVANKYNSVYCGSYAEYKALNYDVSSFNEQIWTIDEDNYLPLIVK